MEIQQLKSLSLEEVQAYKSKAEARKAELIAFKTSTEKDKFTSKMQDELDNLTSSLVDVDDVIEEKKKEEPAKYVPAPGSEKCVHLALLRGGVKNLYNPETGEARKPYTQIFSYGEWQLFKKHYVGLGYLILDVLHDPYGEAEKYKYKKPSKK